MKLTKEQLLAAKNAKNTEELAALAKEFGVEMSAEDLQKTFDTLQKSGELADDELNNVAGGGCLDFMTVNEGEFPDMVCPNCGHVGMDERFDFGFSDLWYIVCPSCEASYRKNANGGLDYHSSIKW